MVTFDLGSEGFNDRSALFDTLNNALQTGVISPFTVSPVGFEFRPLKGKLEIRLFFFYLIVMFLIAS